MAAHLRDADCDEDDLGCAGGTAAAATQSRDGTGGGGGASSGAQAPPLGASASLYAEADATASAAAAAPWHTLVAHTAFATPSHMPLLALQGGALCTTLCSGLQMVIGSMPSFLMVFNEIVGLVDGTPRIMCMDCAEHPPPVTRQTLENFSVVLTRPALHGRADTPAWLSALAAGEAASDGSAGGDCFAGSGGGGDGSPTLTSKASAHEGSGRMPPVCSDSDFSPPELAPVRLSAGCVCPRHEPQGMLAERNTP